MFLSLLVSVETDSFFSENKREKNVGGEQKVSLKGKNHIKMIFLIYLLITIIKLYDFICIGIDHVH